MLLKINMKTEI